MLWLSEDCTGKLPLGFVVMCGFFLLLSFVVILCASPCLYLSPPHGGDAVGRYGGDVSLYTESFR